MPELPDDPTGRTISEAAKEWGVSRDTVRRWVREGAVEAHQDQSKVWRIAHGQEPPPSVSNWRAQRPSLGASLGTPQAIPEPMPAGDPTVDLRDDLAEARQENARLQAQLEGTRDLLAEVRAERDALREPARQAAMLQGQLAEVRAERDHLRQLQDRPSLLDRAWNALQRARRAPKGNAEG